MSDDLHRSPVAFAPSVEVRPDDEAETIEGLNDQLLLIQVVLFLCLEMCQVLPYLTT